MPAALSLDPANILDWCYHAALWTWLQSTRSWMLSAAHLQIAGFAAAAL
jgi:hypothetical protein